MSRTLCVCVFIPWIGRRFVVSELNYFLKSVGLELKCSMITGVFGVIIVVRNPCQRYFLFGMRQYDLFKYSDILKLIHDLWYAINNPDIIVWETCTHHDALVNCGLNSVFQNKMSVAPKPKTNHLAFISPQNVPPFHFKQVSVFPAKFNLVHNETFQGALTA